MLNRIVGSVGVFWGGFMLLSAAIQLGSEEAGAFEARQIATLVFALVLLAFGGYCVIRGSKA